MLKNIKNIFYINSKFTILVVYILMLFSFENGLRHDIRSYSMYFINIFYLLNISFFTMLIFKYHFRYKKPIKKEIFIYLSVFIFSFIISCFLARSLFYQFGLVVLFTIMSYVITIFYMPYLQKNIKYILGLLLIFLVPTFISIHVDLIKGMHVKILLSMIMSFILLSGWVYLFKIDFHKSKIKISYVIMMLIFEILSYNLLILDIYSILILFLTILFNIKGLVKTLFKYKFLTVATIAILAFSTNAINSNDKYIYYYFVALFIFFISSFIILTIYLYKHIDKFKQSNDYYNKILTLFLMTYSIFVMININSFIIYSNTTNDNKIIESKVKLVDSFRQNANELSSSLSIYTVEHLDDLQNEISKMTLANGKPRDTDKIDTITNLTSIFFSYQPLIKYKSQENRQADEEYFQTIKDIKRYNQEFINVNMKEYLSSSDNFIIKIDDVNMYLKQCITPPKNQVSCIVYKNILEAKLKKLKTMNVSDFVKIGESSLKQGSTQTVSSSDLPPKYEIRGDSLYKTKRTQTTYNSKINRYAYLYIPIQNGYCSNVNVKIDAKFIFNPFSPDSHDDGVDSFTGALGGVFEAMFRLAVADATHSTVKEAFKNFSEKHASSNIDVEAGDVKVMTIRLDTKGFVRDGIEMKKSIIDSIEITPSQQNCDRGALLKSKIKIINGKIHI